MNLMEKYQGKQGVQPKPEPIKEQGKAPLPKYTLIYSHILNDYLLLTGTDKDRDRLIDSGIEEVIYTRDEIPKLEGLSPESLRAQHEIKRAFPRSRIEE